MRFMRKRPCGSSFIFETFGGRYTTAVTSADEKNYDLVNVRGDAIENRKSGLEDVQRTGAHHKRATSKW